MKCTFLHLPQFLVAAFIIVAHVYVYVWRCSDPNAFLCLSAIGRLNRVCCNCNTQQNATLQRTYTHPHSRTPTQPTQAHIEKLSPNFSHQPMIWRIVDACRHICSLRCVCVLAGGSCRPLVVLLHADNSRNNYKLHLADTHVCMSVWVCEYLFYIFLYTNCRKILLFLVHIKNKNARTRIPTTDDLALCRNAVRMFLCVGVLFFLFECVLSFVAVWISRSFEKIWINVWFIVAANWSFHSLLLFIYI